MSGITGGADSSFGATDILFENVHIRIAAWTNYSLPSSTNNGAVPLCYANPQICSNESHPHCVSNGVFVAAAVVEVVVCLYPRGSVLFSELAGQVQRGNVLRHRFACLLCVFVPSGDQVQPGSPIPCQGAHDYRPHNNGNCSYYCRTPSKVGSCKTVA